MRLIPRRLPTPAMIVACGALIVALGGVSYAASVLPSNSVGTAQLRKKAVTSGKIKKNAVTGAKVKDHSLGAADFKAGQLPAGPQGPKGDPGQQGLPGAPGQDATNLFAYISDQGAYDDPYDAKVEYGSGVTAVTDFPNRVYSVTFNRSLHHCVVQAVAGTGNPIGSASSYGYAVPEVTLQLGDPTKAQIKFNQTVSPYTPIETSFMITAFC